MLGAASDGLTAGVYFTFLWLTGFYLMKERMWLTRCLPGAHTIHRSDNYSLNAPKPFMLAIPVGTVTLMVYFMTFAST